MSGLLASRRGAIASSAAASGGGGLALAAWNIDIAAMPGLLAWYEPDRITATHLDEINSLNDLSGNGHTLTAPSGRGPTFLQNEFAGRSSLRFDAVSQTYLQSAAIGPESQPNTLVAVALLGGARPYVVGGRNATQRHALGHNITSSSANQMQAFAGSAVGLSMALPEGRRMWTAVYNGASSRLALEGDLTVATGNAGTQPLGGLTLGSYYLADTSFLDGEIALVLAFDTEPDAATLAEIERYASGKWLTLAARQVLTTPTYDGSGQAVHPDVVKIVGGWNGWEYWMAMTPYPDGNDQLENPSILVSSDGFDWQEPAGITNPIVPSPAGADNYNSDCDLVYNDVTDELVLFFRENIDSGTQSENIYVTRSSDGVTWTAPVQIITTVGRTYVLSPTVVKDGATWRMWSINVTGHSPNRMEVRTATDPEGPWSSPTLCVAAEPDGRDLWHLDVVKDGATWRAFIQTVPFGGGGLAGSGLLATSTDAAGETWALTRPIVHRLWAGSDALWDYDVYRGSLLFEQSRWRLWYSGRASSGKWRIGYTELDPVLFDRLPPTPPSSAPDEITGLHAWYAADQIVGLADLDPVATWDDLTANEFDATQANAAKQPTYRTNQLNGLPGIRFESADQGRLATAAFPTALTQPNTIVVVADYDSGGNNRAYITDGITSGNRHALARGLPSDNGRFGLFAGVTSAEGAVVSLPTGPTMWVARFNEAGSSIRKDRAPYSSGNPGSHTLTGLSIGAAFANSFGWFPGTIYEVIVYDRLLASGEVQELEEHLSQKWGL